MMRHVSPFRNANAVRMTSSARKKACHVLVEGVSDAAFYGWHLHQECVIQVANGKVNAVRSLKILLDEGRRDALAIVDADFMRVDNEKPTTNLFLTDGHDLESMLVRSLALDKYLNYHGDSARLQVHQGQWDRVRQKLLAAAFPVGLLRWYSYHNRTNLGFKHINFEDFVNHFEMNVRGLVAHVLGHEHRHLKRQVEQFMARNSNIDPWELCQGHDLMAILAIGMRDIVGGRHSDVVADAVAKGLRASYETVWFKQTDLGLALAAWQKKNPNVELLPS